MSRSTPIVFTLLSLLFIQCDKSKLMDEDIVTGILYKVSNHSQIQFDKSFLILHFNQLMNHEVTQVNTTLLYSDEQISTLSKQFKSLRRNATRSGYGKNPSGWEYFIKEHNDQVKMIIDTFNHQVLLHHEIYYNLN